MQNNVGTFNNKDIDCAFTYTRMNSGRKRHYEPVKGSIIVVSTPSRPKSKLQYVPFIIHMSTAALWHGIPASVGISCDRCRVQGHDRRDTL
jgi:hypothetical protein